MVRDLKKFGKTQSLFFTKPAVHAMFSFFNKHSSHSNSYRKYFTLLLLVENVKS
jgi:hypothetical protein